jgi:hypothetical protein
MMPLNLFEGLWERSQELRIFRAQTKIRTENSQNAIVEQEIKYSLQGNFIAECNSLCLYSDDYLDGSLLGYNSV